MLKKIYKKWQSLMKKCYDYAENTAKKESSLKILGIVSFIESSVFPIPPDIFLIPIVFIQPHKYFKIATICTLSSVLGGILGYLIGLFLFDLVAAPILEFYDYMNVFNEFKEYYLKYGAWIVFFAGLTPFPYKAVTISSGALSLNLPIFIISSIIARGMRFYFVSFLIYKYGEKAKEFIEKHLGWLSVLFFILLFASFFIIKVL